MGARGVGAPYPMQPMEVSKVFHKFPTMTEEEKAEEEAKEEEEEEKNETSRSKF